MREGDGHELIADRVTPDAWRAFCEGLSSGFRGFPSEWGLTRELQDRLQLRLQWVYFNPDLVASPAEKTAKAWAFIESFLDADFRRKFYFLRERLPAEQREEWDRALADFETLLLLSSMEPDKRSEWLGGLDSRLRHGELKRARVIKNKGLGLQSELLGVDPLMDWSEIRARFRFLIKKHHPDLGGDPATTRALVAEFKRLQAEKEGKRPRSPGPSPKPPDERDPGSATSARETDGTVQGWWNARRED